MSDMSIYDYLQRYTIKDGETPNFTSFIGGSYYIDWCGQLGLWDCLSSEKNKKKDITLNQLVPKKGVFKPILDIDGPEDEGTDDTLYLDSIFEINENIVNNILKVSIERWKIIFNVPEDFIFEYEIIYNDKHKNKLKIYFLNIYVTYEQYSDFMNLLKKIMKQHYCNFINFNVDKIFDFPNGCRTIFSKKVDPKTKFIDAKKGSYIPKEGRTRESFEKYSMFVNTSIFTESTFEVDPEFIKFKEDSKKQREDYIKEQKKRDIITEEQAKNILSLLKGKCCDERSTWLLVCKTMCNLGIEESIVQKWSSSSDKYDDNAKNYISRIFDNFDPESPYGPKKGAFGVGYLVNLVRKKLGKREGDEFLKREKIFKNKNEKYFLFGDVGMASLAEKLLSDKIKITYEAGDWYYGYVWNEKTLLWEQVKKEKLIHLVIVETLSPLLKETIDEHYRMMKEEKKNVESEDEESDEEDGGKRKLKDKDLGDLKKEEKRLRSSSGGKAVFESCVNRFQRPEFKDKINKTNEPVIPLKDGFIYNMKTKELRKRTSSDLWSFELLSSIVKDTRRAEYYLRDITQKYDKKEKTRTASNENYSILKKILGYFFLPDQRLKICFNLIGPRDSGKSTLINFIETIMTSEFHKPLNERAIFLTKNKSSHDDENIHALKNSRLAVCSEISPGSVIDTKEIKQIVGGDTISKRACKGRTISFCSQSKIVIVSNDIIQIPQDSGFEDKIFYFEFGNVYEKTKENKEKIESLKSDQVFLDQLFTLTMEGAYDVYQTNKIEGQVGVNEKYSSLGDSFTMWLKNNCEFNEEYRYPVEDAYKDYEKSVEVRDALLNKTTFKKRMTEDREFEIKQSRFSLMSKRYDGSIITKSGNTKCYVGIRPIFEDVEEEIMKDEEKEEEKTHGLPM